MIRLGKLRRFIELEKIEVESAKPRQLAGLSLEAQETLGSNEHKVSDGLLQEGKARDLAAAQVGLSPTTYFRAKTVLEKGSPELLRVEARLGELIVLDQEAGRLTWGGDRRSNQGNNVVTLKDVGLSKMDSVRARLLAAHKDLIPMVVAEAVKREDVPTRQNSNSEIMKGKHNKLLYRFGNPMSSFFEVLLCTEY